MSDKSQVPISMLKKGVYIPEEGNNTVQSFLSIPSQSLYVLNAMSKACVDWGVHFPSNIHFVPESDILKVHTRKITEGHTLNGLYVIPTETVYLRYNMRLEYMKKVGLHEIAHHIDCTKYGSSNGHGERFKTICLKVGGVL